jgi:uncharacterized membrane protein (GlpM family)
MSARILTAPRITLLALAYTAAVLTIDTLIAQRVDASFTLAGQRIPLDFGDWQWRSPHGADWFKLVFWFAIPFTASLPRMDRAWLGWRRWKKTDRYLLAGLVGAGVFAVTAVAFIPALRDIYPSLADRPLAYKLGFARYNALWIASWLLGWEFLLRCALLRALLRWPGGAWWLLIPLAEGLYHLQKPPAEAAGALALGLVLTAWAARRRNVLLPFLVHLAIEIALVAFMLLV